MSLGVKIDFDNCYAIEPLSSDLTKSTFGTEIRGNAIIPIGINISNEVHWLLPEVYNLSFGPFTLEGKIDDGAKVPHLNHSKAFSTILFAALAFLNSNPDKYLGIDGSSNSRAYLYYKIILANYDVLSQYFELRGVNYYIRLLRKLKDADAHHPLDFTDIEGIPRPINNGEILDPVPPGKLYNYLIFRLKIAP